MASLNKMHLLGSSAYQDCIQNWHLSGLLDQAADVYSDRPFISGSSVLTYKEAASKSRQIAAWLQKKAGVKPGDRVMIITMNRAEAVLTAFAVARVGATFTIINNLIKEHGLRQILDQVKPIVVMLDETTTALADEINVDTIVWSGDGPQLKGSVKFNDILTERGLLSPIFPGIDLDPACLIYTSGSSGVPRGVVVSHDNIRFSTVAIQARLRYRTDDVVGLFLPLSFDYGLYQIFLTLQAGASIFLGRPEFTGLELLSKLALYKISVLPGVPTLFAGMFKLLGRRPQSLLDLRCITSTGEHLPQAYIEKMIQLFPEVQVFPMYGLTECKRVSILLPDERETRPQSVGRPLPGTVAYIVGEDGKPLPPGSIGELVVRGRHVTQGYWRANDETELHFRQHASSGPRDLYTGDICRMDHDGFIYFVGRKDDLLKHKGFRISPVEIEATACSIAGVSEAVLVKSEGSDRMHLFVTTINQTITTEKITSELKEQLESYKVPEGVHIVSDLPKTGHRKLDRNLLIKSFFAGDVND